MRNCAVVSSDELTAANKRIAELEAAIEDALEEIDENADPLRRESGIRTLRAALRKERK